MTPLSNALPAAGPLHGIDTPATGRTPGLPQSALLLAGSCLPVMAAVLIAPVLPRIQAHFSDVPNVQVLVPVMLTVPSLVLGLLAPFAGALVDRLGRKRLLLATLIVYGLAGTAPLWLTSLHAIIASRALVGLAEAGIMTCCTTLVGDYYDSQRRERLLTLQTVTASIAATCFFVFGGALGEASWRAPFALYALGFVMFLPAAFLLWEPLRRTPVQRAADDATRFPVAAVTGISAITLLAALGFYLVPVHLSFLLDAMGEHSPQKIGQAIGISSIATVIGAAVYPLLSRFGVARSLVFAFAVMAAGFLWLSRAGDYATVVAAASFTSLGAGSVIPTLVNWMMRSVTFDQRGRGTGAFMASFFIGQFICPLVVIVLGSVLGGGLVGAIHAMGWVLAAMALLAVGAAFVPAWRPPARG